MRAGADLVFKYFPHLTEKQKKQFAALSGLYLDWNAKINVISRKDIDELYERHVLHSLGIAMAAVFKDGCEILDAGTGGGFPGIPLAILYPNSRFHLVDSIGKKIKVVTAIAESLGLSNIKAEQARMEELKRTYNFVVSRAVASMDVFYRWTRPKIKPNGSQKFVNGILYLKGGDLTAELAAVQKAHTVYALSDYFEEEFFHEKKLVYIPFP